MATLIPKGRRAHNNATPASPAPRVTRSASTVAAVAALLRHFAELAEKGRDEREEAGESEGDLDGLVEYQARWLVQATQLVTTNPAAAPQLLAMLQRYAAVELEEQTHRDSADEAEECLSSLSDEIEALLAGKAAAKPKRHARRAADAAAKGRARR